MGLIHWVCTYAGAYAWAPLSSKCLRERFSLLGAYTGCLRRVLSPTLVTSGDSKRAIQYNQQVVAPCDRVTSGSCLQGVYSFATDGQIDFVASRANYSVEAAAHKQHTTSSKEAAENKRQQQQQPSSSKSSSKSRSQAVAAANSFLLTRCFRDRLRGAYAKIGPLIMVPGAHTCSSRAGVPDQARSSF